MSRTKLKADAARGNVAAQYVMKGLAFVTVKSEDGLVDAQPWFRKAAELGYAPGQAWLGVSLLKKDDAEAMKWFRKAAEQGYARAQYNLGVMYAKGEGVEKNAAEAVKWFLKAAEQGDEMAGYRLHRLCKDGYTPACQ